MLPVKWCPPENAEVLTPSSCERGLFWRRSLHIVKLRWGHWVGWALIQGLCPYKKGKFGHDDRHTYRKNDVKKQREDGNLKPMNAWGHQKPGDRPGTVLSQPQKERAMSPPWSWTSGSRLGKEACLLFKHPMWYFVTAAPEGEHTYFIQFACKAHFS